MIAAFYSDVPVANAIILILLVASALLAAIGFFFYDHEPSTRTVYNWATDEPVAEAFADEAASLAAWDRYFGDSALIRVIGKRQVRRFGQ